MSSERSSTFQAVKLLMLPSVGTIDTTNLHADRALVGLGHVGQGHVGPRMVRMSAHLNLPAAHGALQFGVVQRCVGQQPRRGRRGVCIHAQHTDAGNIRGVGGGPTSGGRVGDEAFPVRTITGDRMHFGHARSASFELEVKAELVDQSVVQKVDGNHVLVGALHARDDLPGAVEDGPVEVGAFGDVGLNVHRCVGVSGKELGGACSVAEVGLVQLDSGGVAMWTSSTNQ